MNSISRIHPIVYAVLVFILTGQIKTHAQTFERAEIVAGLEDLQNNNGVATADYDGDLDLDLFVVAHAQDLDGNESTHSKLYQNNNNGTFTDVTLEVGLYNLLPFNPDLETFFGLKGFKHGASWGDYNNDGFPDLFLTNSESVQLFLNQNGTFTEVTESAGIMVNSLCRNTGATWFDYDNDGFLDLYISEWDFCDSNSLYKNNGDGTFTNVTQSSNVQDNSVFASYMAIPFDINEDGWMDVYVTNDFNKPNNLFVNQNGSSFLDQSSNYGLNSMLDDMGATLGDFNLDGSLDVFITGIDENALLQNDGTNHFSEVSISNSVSGTGWAWGTRFSDFDLDGDEDLFIANGFDFQTRGAENNVYYKNLAVEGGVGFEDVSSQLGVNDLTISVGILDFDYDNDGDIDMYITNSDQSSFLYENKLLNFDQENAQHYFKILLEGTASNRDAIGTTLTLTTAQGVFKRYYTGVGFLSQSLQAVHFGLGNEVQVQSLEIKWPSGLIETFQDLEADSTIKAIEGQGYTAMNILPSQKTYGCLDVLSCNYNPEATVDDGSCTYLEAQNILGATNSSWLTTEVYSYAIANTASAQWIVSGGEIVEGQNTNEITILWGLSDVGSVRVRETDGECFSQEQLITVNLGATDIPENISISRLWNEVLLECIRKDFARPTVHARNLFHTSVAMYDIWAIYDDEATPYLIGNTLHNFNSELEAFIPSESIEISRKRAISYAMYRLLSFRFQNSPNAEYSQDLLDLVMEKLGYNTSYQSVYYKFGNAAALGNYVAQTIINYGSLDGSREATLFDNAYYQTINDPLAPGVSNASVMNDPNRWQPLSLATYIDQSGNLIEGELINFLSPEWGNVWPFAMTENLSTNYQRNNYTYKVYRDPGDPPYLNLEETDASSDAYKWGFSLVSVWGSHLDPSDNVIWDISPKTLGNIPLNDLPTSYSEFPQFYNFTEGGDISQGHSLNPITNQPYEEQMVPRGDYTRVLAEFWADGPDSETPPGHWFTILNYVNDHPLLEKRFEGQGDILDVLEWDVKSYFILGGAMHDAAISAWSIKGWYDYVRPISALRNMALLGQSTDPSLANYNVAGIPLLEGYVEIVSETDELLEQHPESLGKVKVYTWKGPDFISANTNHQAGVGWILAENWWPYQRPTFVTPPFAGYVSGHSTYSRAAAEVLTDITGSAFFPGGLGEFTAKQNEFLVFENGPSVDVTLQWATYQDASDQTSLSRIWGGIHPPADDIPGRLIGEKIGNEAFSFAVPYFRGETIETNLFEQVVFPNPVIHNELYVTASSETDTFTLYDMQGRTVDIIEVKFDEYSGQTHLKFPETTAAAIYLLKINNDSKMIIFK
ncbi:FG-GAP-like repeat-containing protein [Sediminibacter sp. Hel_I_10]|uniref:FG-GAP-like repeat-containing protein n=1 Tax=Sediminibacter sp. Hel_I_10 TaxID=1392490 RepID=UPI00047B9404|nr:FG-GAP-like repeat-containing protein [Sediminibacter sp. Hel_I_10]